MNKFVFQPFVSFLLLPLFLCAQTVVTGFVRDAETREILPAANIQIAGTLRGTITNNEGRFQIELEHTPATLLFSYIGYASREITFSENEPPLQNILLKPIILESEAIIVTAEDPAINIMRKVIRKKQEWRTRLESYKANAYSRLVLKNDSGIVFVAESISDAFWHKEKGSREVIRTKRQTGNMNEEGNFATASYIPNFYDDDIEINGFKMIGPTHASALEYYTFKLTGKRMRDDKIVYDIDVIPTSLLQPTFIGHLAVLDEDYAMIAAELKPNENILFPPPIQKWDLYYRQQFSNFGQAYWLPVDIRIDGDIKIGFTGLQFPTISYSQLSHLSDYEVNIELPDSLYKTDDIFTTDSSTIDSTVLFSKNPDFIPLTQDEKIAYETLDSTMTLQKAFRPTGMLARFVEVESNVDKEESKSGASILDGFGPQVFFNRVDELHLGLTYEKQIFERLKGKASAGYKTGLKRWGYSSGLEYTFGDQHNTRLLTRYSVDTERQFQSDNYSKVLTSVLPLFAFNDYFDYYWYQSFRTEVRYRYRNPDFLITLGFNNDRHSSLNKSSDYNIVNSDKIQRINPPVDSGMLRSLDLSLVLGENRIPFGIAGQNRVELTIEHSSSTCFGSDFEYTRYLLAMDIRLNTWLKRRLLPNALDMRLMLGASTGTLPLQKYFGIDGNLHVFTPFGTFRTLNGRHLSGDQVAVLFWEHNFRTVPFELLGLDYLARKGWSVLIHGSHGRTWINDKSSDYTTHHDIADSWLNEAGVSLSGIFDLLRLDGTWRLDRPGFYMGAGLSRFF